MEEVRRTGSREGLPYVGGEGGGAGRMEESSLKPVNVERGCLSLEETSKTSEATGHKQYVVLTTLFPLAFMALVLIYRNCHGYRFYDV